MTRQRRSDWRRQGIPPLPVVPVRPNIADRVAAVRAAAATRKKTPSIQENEEMTNLVPLVTIAAELGTTADRLASRFGDGAVIEDDCGIRCITRERARELIAAHRAAVQAAREKAAARRAELAAQPNPLRDRVRALQAAQAHFADGHDVPAVYRMLGAEHEQRPLDEMFLPAGSALPYHSLTTTKDG